MKAEFVVEGRPVPKARPRLGKYTTYTPQKTRSYERDVRAAWRIQSNVKMPDGKPLRAIINAYYSVPKSWTKIKIFEIFQRGAWHTVKPDMDNVIKSVLDALNGYAYKDDSAVAQIIADKRYIDDDNECVCVTIEEL